MSGLDRTGVRVVGVAIAALGVLLLAGAAWYSWEAFDFWRTTERVEGTVIEHVPSGQSRAGDQRTSEIIPMFRPVIRFTDADGRDVEFRSQVSQGDPPPVGSTVTVRYPAADPYAARVGGLEPLMGGATVLGVLGVVMLGAGALMLRLSRRR